MLKTSVAFDVYIVKQDIKKISIFCFVVRIQKERRPKNWLSQAEISEQFVYI